MSVFHLVSPPALSTVPVKVTPPAPVAQIVESVLKMERPTNCLVMSTVPAAPLLILVVVYHEKFKKRIYSN